MRLSLAAQFRLADFLWEIDEKATPGPTLKKREWGTRLAAMEQQETSSMNFRRNGTDQTRGAQPFSYSRPHIFMASGSS